MCLIGSVSCYFKINLLFPCLLCVIFQQKWNMPMVLSSLTFSLLSALPVTRIRTHPPAHQSCVNIRAPPHRRARRVRTWWRRALTTPLTSPPPLLSRLSTERTQCSLREAVERTPRWAIRTHTFVTGHIKSTADENMRDLQSSNIQRTTSKLQLNLWTQSFADFH